MRDWNAIITVHDDGFTPAFQRLKTLGLVQKTEFYNILIMKAEYPLQVLATLHAKETWPEVSGSIARFMPLQRLFTFNSVAELEERLRESVAEWLPRLAGATFHVRMHRRGFKGRISSMDEERFLDNLFLEALQERNTPGAITFADPDVIIALETLGPRAGLSLWDRMALQRFALLHLD